MSRATTTAANPPSATHIHREGACGSAAAPACVALVGLRTTRRSTTRSCMSGIGRRDPSRAPCRPRCARAPARRPAAAPARVRDRLQHLELVRAVERPAPREQLVQHDAEREHVAARVERLSRGLLGRHVRDRADDDAGARVLRGSRARLAAIARPRRRASRARSPRASRSRCADQDVAGLHVAMQHAGRVRGRERVRDAGQELDALPPACAARSRSTQSSSVPPSTSSLTMYCWPSCSPTS